MTVAFQDFYDEDFSHCYGCGKDNPHGHQLKSYWANNKDTNRTIAKFTPDNKFTGGTVGIVYGGMIASLLDCHGTGSAAAYAYKAQDREMGDDLPPIRCVTASLKVDYLAPTPLGVELTITGNLQKIEGRKIWVDLSLTANGIQCAKGEMLAIALKTE